MPTNAFEELLLQMSTEIAEASQAWRLDEGDVMFIVRKRLNPFDQKPKDGFQQLIKIWDMK